MNSPSRNPGLLLAATFALSLAGITATAQEGTTAATTTAQPPAKSSPSDLVAAAKASRDKRAASAPRKKITNADVKKSKARLIYISEAPMPDSAAPAAATAQEPGKVLSLAEEEAARLRARKDAEERLKVARKKVDDLAIQLTKDEQAYYASNDFEERDTVLKSRFEETKRQLAAARSELEAAREAAVVLGVSAGQ